jgi:ABC-type microcin C transport system duplicated ATPase subunit YejF
MDQWKAQVRLSTGAKSGSSNLQWVFQDANNSFEARLAIESKYGKIIQGPIKVSGNNNSGSFYDRWKNA